MNMHQSTGRSGIARAMLFMMTAFAVTSGSTVAADDAPVSEVRESVRKASLHVGMSLGNVIRTDDRYGHDGLFQGPRGWAYWNFLERPKPIQNPNLWPDTQSTYFIGRFAMPPGSSMTLRGRFPYARFFQFALYKFQRATFVSIGEALRGSDFEPDPGSINPFRVGADRLAEQRNYTIRVLAEPAPKDASQREANTLYVGRDGAELQGVIRIYLADQDRDGAGWGPADSPFAGRGLPAYEATLADGTVLTAEQVVQQFGKPFSGGTKQPMNTDQWVDLVNSRDNDPALPAESAPARNPPQWEKYWTNAYTLIGAFKSAAERAKIPYDGAMEGGGEGPYLVSFLSREFGPVGQVVDGIADYQVPLDADRNYTIVISRPEDRPKNATQENGVSWLKWSPRGEGLSDARNRDNFGMLIMRIMGNNPTWDERPDRITKPGTGEAVMGRYFPRGYYTTTSEFEMNGAKRP
jgi:hypothetical protein